MARIKSGDWCRDCEKHIVSLAKKGTLGNRYTNSLSGAQPCTIHLGVFVEPFLSFLLEGKKTVESRFSRVKCAPYEQVQPGDILAVKKAGGPIVGLCRIESVWSYELDRESWRRIRDVFGKAICPDGPGFWSSRRHASYATLMSLTDVVQISPFTITKRDRRGWVVVSSPQRALGLAAGAEI